MSHFNHILVVADPTAKQQKALARAKELVSKQAAKVTLFLSIYDFSYEMTTMLSPEERTSMKNAVIQDREAWLQQLLDEHQVQAQVKVIWHNRPYESIIKEVLSADYDLVIKGTHQHDVLKSVIFTPTDWHLLRKCPVSVLLVKEHAWPEQGKVLAAVSAGARDEAHGQLNAEIIKHASAMSQVLNAQTHLINAYPPTPMNIAVEIPEFDPGEYNSNLKRHHQQAVAELADEFALSENNLHIFEGMPEDVIPRAAKELDAELLVMGTIGRSGISAALIGNTAEHVIDNINCDLLALKPPGFQCPVKLK